MKGWLSSKSTAKVSSQSLNSLSEVQQLEDAMRAVEHIMNDDLESAEAGLNKGNSVFHKVGKGTVSFMRATLGFEQDVMREATSRLAEAEASALKYQVRAQKGFQAFQAFKSEIYPPGSEFALCHALTQVMSAVVGVLNENVTEALRGFYKLRKAYVTLENILEAEKRWLEKNRKEGAESEEEFEIIDAPSVGSTGVQDSVQPRETLPSEGLRGDQEFHDGEELANDKTPAERDLGSLGTTRVASSAPETSQPSTSQLPSPSSSKNLVTCLSPADLTNPVDIYIHSGTCVSSGILNLLISLIPPAFSRLLAIIGFRGDRNRGLDLLWRASQYQNLNAATAALALLGYYHNLVGFCDILPTIANSNEEALPRERLDGLLEQMRARYPKGHLWLLEDARVYADRQDLETSVAMLVGPSATSSPLRQVEALQCFQASLDNLFLHRYQAAADLFVRSTELNNWSHGMYYYIAGACHVELYRLCQSGDIKNNAGEGSSAHHAARAHDLLAKAAQHTGKKRLIARRLPFDAFIDRKLAKWVAIAKSRKCELIDAAGVSPAEEMVYFWGGYKKMRTEALEESLRRLQWKPVGGEAAENEELDECAVRAVLSACVKRHLGAVDAAKDFLQREILGREKDWPRFKGGNKDSWAVPVGCYEMAVCCWLEAAGPEGGYEGDRLKLMECSKWLDKVARWERYDLDARVGLKVVTGKQTLRKLEVPGA